MKNLIVLIVEDDKWLAEQLSRTIKNAGYKTNISFNAPSAIKSIIKQIPDAIILDVLLGPSTAFALLHELQSYNETGDIPVIMCTNLANELSIEKLQDYGVRKILDKATMRPDDLVTSLKGVLW